MSFLSEEKPELVACANYYHSLFTLVYVTQEGKKKRERGFYDPLIESVLAADLAEKLRAVGRCDDARVFLHSSINCAALYLGVSPNTARGLDRLPALHIHQLRVEEISASVESHLCEPCSQGLYLRSLRKALRRVERF